ncbi:hypothetical protein B0A54_03906 [Friedmanniomyces endolithicus]|uniref:RING-type domain-containing protein n=1 Tax=Friedmanniomyces endolithicus TaxID=329885 RepID=A0A4U0VD57_9PEZI|nr:hypothetical protein B0A54_03906 [Friedmanniomyces endolithicus]
MSHSKRNTSLAFFTAHERAEVANHWGSRSTRLTRDSFLPFGSCQLCLLPAREAIACPKYGHLFCRECAVSNLLAQSKDLKRLKKEAEKRGEEDAEERVLEEGEQRAKEVEDFERVQAGLSVRNSSDKGDAKSDLPSFWVPGETPDNKKADLKTIKQHPTCPAAAADKPHDFTLKTLVTVHFNEEPPTSASGPPTRSCPSCHKALSNSTKAVLAKPCGHVLCKPCSDKFQKPPEKSAHDVDVDETVRCFVCAEDVTQGRIVKRKKDEVEGKKEKEGKVERGLVELSSEGTGFAGGGGNMVKKEGVAFKC